MSTPFIFLSNVLVILFMGGCTVTHVERSYEPPVSIYSVYRTSHDPRINNVYYDKYPSNRNHELTRMREERTRYDQTIKQHRLIDEDIEKREQDLYRHNVEQEQKRRQFEEQEQKRKQQSNQDKLQNETKTEDRANPQYTNKNIEYKLLIRQQLMKQKLQSIKQ